MTTKELGTLLKAVSDKWKYRLDELENEKFRIDVAIPLKNGAWRHQFVYIWIKKEEKETYVYMNSRIGQFDSEFDMSVVLKQAGFCKYSAVTILPDHIDNEPVESLCVSACPNVKVIDIKLIDQILYDVAYNADYLEMKFFDRDRY